MPSPSSYASSTYSTSTTYTVDALKASSSSSSSSSSTSPSRKQQRSLGQKFKSVLTSMGEHPTARYDRKHGLEPKPLYAPVMPVSKI
ncbi:hypothetical protein G7054_g912 [Neopestalotiopsis clavispora]|nr:hypothetical protein G7054_g912 [Neopestalotiopsis clavispora]